MRLRKRFKDDPPKYHIITARGDTAYAYSDEELDLRVTTLTEHKHDHVIYELKVATTFDDE